MPSGSEGQADSNLTAAGPGTGEQQICHIRARDDQDQANESHQHLDECEQLWSLPDAALQFRANRRATVVIRFWILAFERCADGGEFSLRRLLCGSRVQPALDYQVMAPAILERIRRL